MAFNAFNEYFPDIPFSSEQALWYITCTQVPELIPGSATRNQNMQPQFFENKDHLVPSGINKLYEKCRLPLYFHYQARE